MVDPYKFADAQWACARDAEGRICYYKRVDGAKWEAPPGTQAFGLLPRRRHNTGGEARRRRASSSILRGGAATEAASVDDSSVDGAFSRATTPNNRE